MKAGVQGSGFRVQVQELELRVQSLEFRIFGDGENLSIVAANA
jgi:hypothetical protein